jgi:hypothetical protein
MAEPLNPYGRSIYFAPSRNATKLRYIALALKGFFLAPLRAASILKKVEAISLEPSLRSKCSSSF